MSQHTLKGRYTLEAKLGEGAMGKVYRAMDHESGDYVAIKTISKQHAADEEYRQRFTREITALRKLSHPHIIGYVDTFSLDGQGFLVTEFFSGGTLRTLMTQQKQLADGVFKNIALKTIDAVASAHEAGVIHRDLKPENIFLTATGDPKVGDFGLARVDDLSTLTKTGTIMGTIAYMPPEAFDTFMKVDHRLDIWALGIIMFEMLTGSLPFRARNQSEIIAAILTDKPIPLLSIRKDVPPAWTDIILRCLEKDPNNRYESARDLQTDLRSDRAGVAYARSEKQLRPNPAQSAQAAILGNPQSAVEGVLQDSEPSAKVIEEYQPIFIKPDTSDAPVDIRARAAARSHPQAVPAQSRRAKDLPFKNFDEPPKKKIVGLLILSGLLVYGGIGITLASAGLTVIGFAQGEKGMGISIDTLLVLQTMGTLIFCMGLFLEMFTEEGWRQWMMGGMVITAGLAWFFFMSGIVLAANLLSTFMGMFCFLFMMAAYMQYKR